MAFVKNSPDTAKDKRTGFTFRGEEIVLSKVRGHPFSGLVAKGMQRGIYPEAKRIEVVTLFSATGNFGRTSELSKVPEKTIRAWRKQEWFQELLMEIRDENNEKIDAKFTEIVEKSLEQISDRIENGDFTVNAKTGELMRRPVGVRDLSLVAAINIDKRQLLRGLPTSRTEQIADKSSGKLEKLADAFMALANKTKPRYIEVQTVEVLDDNQEKRQGLQSGIGEVGSEPRLIEDSGRSQKAA